MLQFSPDITRPSMHICVHNHSCFWPPSGIAELLQEQGNTTKLSAIAQCLAHTPAAMQALQTLAGQTVHHASPACMHCTNHCRRKYASAQEVTSLDIEQMTCRKINAAVVRNLHKPQLISTCTQDPELASIVCKHQLHCIAGFADTALTATCNSGGSCDTRATVPQQCYHVRRNTCVLPSIPVHA